MKSPTLKATHKQSQIAPKAPWQWQFLHPKFWGIWLGIMFLVSLVLLPLRVQFFIGRQLGKLLFLLLKSRKQDTLTNLRLAYPTKSDDERHQMARQVFINQGIGIFESLSAWFNPEKFQKSFSISGLQHLITAQKDGRAVLLLGAHYTVLDLGGLLCTQFFALDCVYRPQNNPLLEWLVFNQRRKIYEVQIASRDMKTLASRIKAGKVIWYTPDQDFGLSHGIMSPFFGVPAATITAPRRIARLGDKQNPPLVMTIAMHRVTPDFIPKGKRPHYELALKVVDNYPTNDEQADTDYLNKLIEANINKDPTQWMWFHRRFKTQQNNKNYYTNNH